LTEARDTAPDEGWGSLKVDELKAELEARGLPKSGTKAELVARLEGDDAAPAADAPPAEAPSEDAAAAAETADASAEDASDEDASDPAGADAPADDAPADTDAEEPSAEDADEPAAEKPRRRRRGSVETSAAPAPRRRRSRDGDEGPIVIRARSKYVRSAPRKARLVMGHIRGKDAEQARAILAHTPRAASVDILKLLNSAIANAEANHELGPDELTVRRAYVDEGPTIKRFQPRALGRATQIKKRSSHMTIELVTTSRSED
jgi:large subunit ribosomal protein L22